MNHTYQNSALSLKVFYDTIVKILSDVAVGNKGLNMKCKRWRTQFSLHIL